MKRTTASGGLMAIGFGLAVLLPCTAAGSFQNDTVSNLVLWLAADMGVTTNASGVVTDWTDQSSSGRDATLLAGDPKLHLTSFADGKPAIWFDGNTDVLSFSSITDIRTTVWVVNEDAGASASPGSTYKVVLGHPSKYDFHRGDGTPRGLFGMYTAAAVKNGNVYYNGTSVLFSATVPTVPVIIAVTTTGNVEASQIGRDRTTTANSWHGYIAEVMCFTHVLSAAELNTVGWYLSSKYGISSAYEPDPLGVSADPATGVGLNVATLNGSVTGDGGEGNPYVYFCWDTSDKETASTGAWTHVVSMGNSYGVGDSFNHPLSSLSEDQAYAFRVYATNTAGDTVWSGLRSFSTFGPPEVIQTGSGELNMTQATLLGEVMSTGGQATTAGFEYWQTGEAVTSSVSAGIQSGSYQAVVLELAADTDYTFHAWASNTLGGKVVSSTGTFRTLDVETRIFTWTGDSGTDWFNAANWSVFGDPGYPDEFATVVIPAGKTVLLTNETAELYSFSITDSTLTFSNWNTRLIATNVTIHANGNLTHAPVNTNDAPGVTNRVWIDSTTFRLEQGGQINVLGKGFITMQGEGAPANGSNGAGHGGKGGRRDYQYPSVGQVYGSTNAPILPGSGGGWNGSLAAPGGSGGGAVRIETVTAVINGIINADGAPATGGHCGGGSGGSIYISSDTVSGTGTLRAEGGGIAAGAGAGGGGRIALTYDPAAQAGVSPPSALTFSVKGAAGVTSEQYGEIGTIYFTDTQLMPPALSWPGSFYFDAADWTVDWLTVSNVHVMLPPALTLNVLGDLTIRNNGRLDYRFATAGTESLSIGGALFLTNTASLYLHAAATNGAATLYGGLLDMAGTNAIIPSDCAIYTVSHPVDGGSIKMRFGDLTVASGGAINADGLGYVRALGTGGPGAGGVNAGGGHGGKGGERSGYSNTAGGLYGATNAPIEPGSAGGANAPEGVGPAGNGGGTVWIEASSIEVLGTISANGVQGPLHAGGGSGGGIFMLADTFNGSGPISANGGDGNGLGAGGGGGRIAIWIGVPEASRNAYLAGNLKVVIRETTNPFYTGDMTVDPGTVGDPAAEAGTKFFFTPSIPAKSVIRFR